MLDSFFRTGKNYYSQLFIEESKYVVEEKKISKYILLTIQKFFQILIEKILMKKILIEKALIKKIKKY